MRRMITMMLLLAVAMPAAAQSDAKRLEVGDSIPKTFEALDSLGREMNFESVKGENGLVLIFTRSADWCQYCKAQLRDWNSHVALVNEAGYKLAAISYDTPEQLGKFHEANQLSYTLLSDEASAMIDAFGIRNTKFSEGSRFYGIPNPAIYVIDANGKITSVFREENYQERPEVAEVLAAIGMEMPEKEVPAATPANEG